MGLYSPRSLAVFFDILVLISLKMPTGVRTQVSSLSCLVCTSYSYRDPDLAQQNIGLQDLDCENGIVNGGSVTVEECASIPDSCATITTDIIGNGTNGQPVRSVIRACAQAPSLTCIPPSGAISFFLSSELDISITDVQGKMCYCSDRSQCNDGSTIGPITTAGPADIMAPTIVVPCPANITLVAPQGSTTIPVVWTEPSAVDDSGSVTTTNNFSPGDGFPIGTTTVRYTFVDAAENSASCSFLVTIEGSTTVDPFQFLVPCPSDILVSAPAGQPGVEISWREPVVVDSQGNIVNAAVSFPPMQFFLIGTSKITYTYSDSFGNSDSCSFDIIVQDSVITDVAPPIITVECPTTINLVAPQGSTFATVTWTEPRVVDDSGLKVTTISNFNPGDQFPIGTSTVRYTFIYPSGNTAECSFPVVIQGKTENSNITVIVTAISGVLFMIGVTCSSVSLFYCLCKNRSLSKERQAGKKEQPEPEVTYSRRIDNDYADNDGDRAPHDYFTINSLGGELEHS